MRTATELALASCRACGEGLRGCWAFAPDDLYCGLCGRQVFRLAFREDVVRKDSSDEPEVWLYAATGEELLIHVWGLHGVQTENWPSVAIAPEIDFRASTARFASPELGTRDFAIELAGRHPGPPASLANPTPCPTQPGRIPRAASLRLKLVPKNGPIPLDQIPPNGVPGRIALGGPHGGVRAARLLQFVAMPLEFSPPSTDDSPPELIGYSDEHNFAEVQLEVKALARVVVRDIRGDGSGLRGIRPITSRGISLPCEFVRGRQVQLTIRFKTDPSPEPRQPITINWELAGFAKLVPYTCLVTLRQRPQLAIRPNGDLLEEVSIGGRPVEFDLVLVPSGEGSATPEIQKQPELVLDPPEGEWLRAESFSTLPYLLDNPHPVRFTLDTSRLDRTMMHGRMLTATIRFVDQAGSVWEHTLRLRAVRLPPHDGVLAIDWGTTNTCAAHADSAETRPQPLALPPPMWRDDPPDYEQFPSVIYIEDLSNPLRPVFHIGPSARILAARRARPECLIHSLKRRFFAGVPVYVQDEVGRRHEYPVEELTRLVLLKLVELAEHELGREVRYLGFTFPTKWPTAVRRRFARVLRRVAADLSTARRHGPVEVYISPPDIDEANAVALNVLQAMQLDGKLSDNQAFTLVAYDFGGGTIDTSILQVQIDSSAEPALTTRYVGIGGTGDFGGDEVTRATAELLRDRINRELATEQYELPVRRPGDPPEPAAPGTRRPDLQRDLNGLRNWERLREVAEEIKKLLCQPAGTVGTEEPVRTVIQTRLEQFVCHTTNSEGTAPARSLDNLVGTLFSSSRDPFFANIQFGLDEVCNRKLGSGASQFTVAERIRDTFLEIKAQLADAGNLTADIIVLAGGGCRLPLVADMVREYLDGWPAGSDSDKLIYEPGFAKQRVAHGKATYLAFARESHELTHGLARSVEVLHRPLVVTRTEGLVTRREIIVKVGEPIHAPDRPYEFKFTRRHLKVENGHRTLRLSVLSWQSGKWVPSLLGYFNLDDPVSGDMLPPLDGLTEPVARLYLTRLDPSDLSAELEVSLSLGVQWSDGRAFGPFQFVPQVGPGELISRLQGEGG